MADVYLWRQVFILMTTIVSSISVGNMISFPSILYPALLSKNANDIDATDIDATDIEATEYQLSYITTGSGITGLIGFFILSPILQVFGRKVVHITICLFLFIGWIILALAHSVTAIYAARIIQGIILGGIFIHAIIISEYSDPNRRGYFATFNKVAPAIGTLMCHSLSIIWNWRQIAILSISVPAVAIVGTLFWPESPSYLAMKGRFIESKRSFIWLHGNLKMQEIHLLHSSQAQSTKTSSTEKWYKFLLKKDFTKPFAIVSLLTLILELCGKHYFAVYVIQIMNDLVRDKSLAIYFSVGADLFTIVALMSSCFIVLYFKRRTILFSFGLSTVILMFTIFVVVFSKLSKLAWLAPALIILHTFIVNISIIPLSFVLFGEMLPLEHKGYGSCLAGVVFTSVYTVLLILTPILMDNTGVGGVYGIYGIVIAISLFILYFIMPETKDKTLTEIENEFKGVKMLTNDENKVLH